MVLKLILILASAVLLWEAVLVAKEKDEPETAFQVTCGDTVIIVTPATANRLDEVERLARCMGSEKGTCTIDTVKLTRKVVKP